MALYAPGASQRRTVKVPKNSCPRTRLCVAGSTEQERRARTTPLTKSLGLPRSSAYRILETLEELQYVEGSATDSRFRVTDSAWLLARGVTGKRLGSVAGPIIRQQVGEIAWLIEDCSFEAGGMFTQETTNTPSPMSLARSLVGIPLPLLRTASARAFLAFSAPDEQTAMLALARAAEDPADLPSPPAARPGPPATCPSKRPAPPRRIGLPAGDADNLVRPRPPCRDAVLWVRACRSGHQPRRRRQQGARTQVNGIDAVRGRENGIPKLEYDTPQTCCSPLKFEQWSTH